MLSDDFYARRLVHHLMLQGQVRLALHGPVQRLLRRGRISAHRRIDTDGVCIDTWIVLPRVMGERGMGVSPMCDTAVPAVRSTGILPVSSRDRQNDQNKREDTGGTPVEHTGKMPVPRFRGTVLTLHGLWDSKALMLTLAHKLALEGFATVMPDLRCHGWSTGKYVTYGYREKHDLVAVMRSLTAEGLLTPGSPTYVLGFSCGGVIAPQFAALCADCRGLLLLAPVASARLIMRRMLKFAAPFKSESACQKIIDRAGEIAGFNVDAASAIEAAKSITCPAVVAHGLRDHTVPPSHGRAIFDALAGPKQFVSVPWAGHNSLLWGKTRWIVQQFVRFAVR